MFSSRPLKLLAEVHTPPASLRSGLMEVSRPTRPRRIGKITFPRNTLRRVDARRLVRLCPLFQTWMTATLPCVAMRYGPPGLCYAFQGDVIPEPFEGLHRPLALLCLLSRLEG